MFTIAVIHFNNFKNNESWIEFDISASPFVLQVTKVVSTSGRWVYQVIGSSGTPYVCFPHSIFCQCPAFKFSVLKKRESVICKHVLAARLATAMGMIEEKCVSDEYIRDVLTHLD